MGVRGVLYVSLLGSFSLRYVSGETTHAITEQESTSRRLWTFLQYLFAFSQRSVSQDELIDVLWGDSDISNPVNTLKTLLHRSRQVLESLGIPDGKEALRYRRGIYSWSPELDMRVDANDFETLCAQFAAAPQSTEGLEAAAKAVELYRGDFLPAASGSPWAVSLRTYYHDRFLQLCCDLANALRAVGRTEDAIGICRTATTVDPYDESCHLLLMELLAASGAQQAALQHYAYVSNLFMDQLGVAPSDNMVAFYHTLAKSAGGLELDLHTVRDHLLEKERHSGVYFCDYIVFQDIYRLMARSAQRSGQVVELVMMTLFEKQGRRLEPNDAAAAMDDLRSAIHSSLRSGDVFTRSSAVQFLILLPSASYENGVKVCQRVLTTFRQAPSASRFRPEFSLLPVRSFPEEHSSSVAGFAKCPS